MRDVEICAMIARCERMVLGTLKLYAQEVYQTHATHCEQIAELFERLTALENEVAALLQREGHRG